MVGRMIAAAGLLAVAVAGCGFVQDESAGVAEPRTSRDGRPLDAEERRRVAGLGLETEGGADPTTTVESTTTTSTTTTAPPDPDAQARIDALNAGHTLCGAFDDLVASGYRLFNESPDEWDGSDYASGVDDLADLAELARVLSPPESKSQLAEVIGALGGFSTNLRASTSMNEVIAAATDFVGAYGVVIDSALRPISNECPPPSGHWFKVAPENWWSVSFDTA